MPKITDAKILILATHGFEQSELEVPRDQLREKGATVHVASPGGEDIKGWDTDDWGRTVAHDMALEHVRMTEYDALVLPGGQINPDLLRVNPDAIRLIRDFVEAGRPVAAVCHAPWLLIEAGVARGREMTSYASIRTDLENAGARVVDREVVVSDGIVTSRNPGDLDAFVSGIVEAVEDDSRRRDAA
ncbi:type 1 glutamine amidotransferase domain-containing protein [Histidinibacterium lentulum]|uniref:Type 1 glutamine amidotransferase n=1 Tax=Histidinibacterium lentulum TaxID=2480588 RepID=A0A3N2R7Q0_9RHOB|nr:type 1 glutamine amidotransferase domain-containing protein [Histidinibacterium lentulum]ROU03510.1 type 1 glutamine amidotransferase [Histidinibacterium lentulum]